MTGRPAFEHVYGEPFFSHLGHDPEQAALFNAAMSGDTANDGEMLDAYDFSGAATIVDVGGGHGALLRGILARAPHAKGILFDLPAVVAETAAEDKTHPLVESRYERVGGDMFASVPAGGDLYILKRILHDWSDAEAIQILRNCHEAMHPHGKLLLIESIRQPSTHADPAMAADLMMLVLVSGRERTEEEFRRLLAAAGLRLTRVIPAGLRSLIEATGDAVTA
jgi:O-methyltransferase